MKEFNNSYKGTHEQVRNIQKLKLYGYRDQKRKEKNENS